MSYSSLLARLSDMFSKTPLSNRNYIIDGNFDFWLNSSSSTHGASASYSNASPMYIVGAGVGGTSTLSLSSVVPGGEPLGMTTPVYSLATITQTVAGGGTAAASTAPLMVQNIEGVRTLAGRSATFSVWLQSSVPLTISTIRVLQGFGTGGSPSASVVADKTVNWVVNGSSTLQRFSVRLDIPSISGKTMGTTSNNLLQIGLWLPTGITYTLFTGQWQLEQSSPYSSSDLNGSGGAPTAYEYRGTQAEFARFQRYYQNVSIDFETYAASGNNVIGSVMLPVWMRTVPSASLLTAYSIGGVGAAPTVFGLATNKFSLSQSCASSGQTFFVGGTHVLDARL